ncbi:MAG: hypothetical protein ACUZ8I_09450 [Candidatus Scalindua sp.]
MPQLQYKRLFTAETLRTLPGLENAEDEKEKRKGIGRGYTQISPDKRRRGHNAVVKDKEKEKERGKMLEDLRLTIDE